jgi:hypothetical protein
MNPNMSRDEQHRLAVTILEENPEELTNRELYDIFRERGGTYARSTFDSWLADPRRRRRIDKTFDTVLAAVPILLMLEQVLLTKARALQEAIERARALQEADERALAIEDIERAFALEPPPEAARTCDRHPARPATFRWEQTERNGDVATRRACGECMRATILRHDSSSGEDA